METAHAGQTVFIVQKLDWQYNDNWYELQEDTPVKAFADRALAQKYCDELVAQEQERWATFSAPYDEGGTALTRFFGGLSRMTTLDEAEFIHIVGNGTLSFLPTWEMAGDNWYTYRDLLDSWWAGIWKTLSPEKRAWLWSLFDLIQFYEVIEVELMQ